MNLYLNCVYVNFYFYFNNIISFIQMLATNNIPKVQAPFGVSLLHPLLIIEVYNQNYMNVIQTKYYINTFRKHLFNLQLVCDFLLSLKMHNFGVFSFLLFF